MCRFLAYKGENVLMSDLLMQAEHSLIRQSYHAKERDEPLNGDGFGVGWYIDEDPVPCFFTSITPAWSNSNLHRLSEKIKSSCFFAHVRAATYGLVVSEVNCHPFQYGPYLWMHNGLIGPFSKIKRQMRESLSDEHYDIIQGTTDSEHAFAIFMDFLGGGKEKRSLEELKTAMEKTIKQILDWSNDPEGEEPSYLNFAVTDGEKMVATRFISHKKHEPPTLYISCGSTFELVDGDFRMSRDEKGPRTTIISSEPLTNTKEDWVKVPKNSIVLVSSDNKVEMSPIRL